MNAIDTTWRPSAAVAADRAAHNDRDTTATRVLRLAVEDAIQSIRHGQHDWARHQLQTAGESAERILGPTLTSGAR